MIKLILASLVSAVALFMLAGLVGLAGLAGCDDVDRSFDCNQICDRYRDCFASDYDVSACVSDCEDNAEDSEDFDEHADDCENCLDDKSCSEAFACTLECIGIVP